MEVQIDKKNSIIDKYKYDISQLKVENNKNLEMLTISDNNIQENLLKL